MESKGQDCQFDHVHFISVNATLRKLHFIEFILMTEGKFTDHATVELCIKFESTQEGVVKSESKFLI